MHGSVDHKIYVQPLGFLRGCNAFEAIESGSARWMAGRAIAFGLIKIIYRQSGKRQGSAIVSFSQLNEYMAGLATFQQSEISRQLSAISHVRHDMPCGRRKMLNWEKPLLQGIVNVTPDSFSDGGTFNQADRAILHARDMIEAGADIIDIGGESTRPGAVKVGIQEELDRVIPVIEGLSDISCPISIDTRNAQVMEEALKAGADIINDVSALTHDDQAMTIVSKSDCPVMLMHAQNSPDNMQDSPVYDDVILDVYDFLQHRIEACLKVGIDRNRIIVDPGIGFGKTVEHNLELISNLSLFHCLGVPILLGVSRKSFIGYITGEQVAAQRGSGSLAFAQSGYDQGVQIMRVHDLKESKQALSSWLSAKK